MAKLPDFFGIDIGESSIKIAKSDFKSGKIIVNNLGISEVSDDVLQNKSERGIEQLAEKIKEAGKPSGISTRNCVLTIPEAKVFSKLVSLPEMKPEDLEEAIHWAAKPFLPIPIESVNLAYLKVDTKEERGQKLNNYYLVAAPKDLIEYYERLISKVNLRLLAIETQSLAVARYVRAFANLNEDLMIIDIGSVSSMISVTRNNVPVFTQSVNSGSESMTKVIAADYGIDEIQAEKYKRTFGMDTTAGQGKIAKSIEPVVNIIKDEILRTITYYRDKLSGQSLKKIAFTGGGSNVPFLKEYLASAAKLELILRDGKTISVSKDVQSRFKPEEIEVFATAIGLSLKGKI
ncbi:MAG: hypothetical protein Kow0081_2330 [Candidatus Dojkabacteria bacterium]